MSDSNTVVRRISDNARWVAYFRARETQRPDALFRDPYAERLAGEYGFQIANTLPEGKNNEWAWVARTYLFDNFLLRELHDGADLVLNLGAGLDARPYRMELPSDLVWIEVDLPETVAYKHEILAIEKPRCELQRISLDLSDLQARRSLFADLNKRGRKAVVMSEGLLIYLTGEEVAMLANDLATATNFRSWIIDLASPGQLKLMQRTTGVRLGEAGAAFKFGPAEGPNFFLPYGWEPSEVQGLLNTAAKFKRSPAGLRPLVANANGVPVNFPWTGVCLLKRNPPLLR